MPAAKTAWRLVLRKIQAGIRRWNSKCEAAVIRDKHVDVVHIDPRAVVNISGGRGFGQGLPLSGSSAYRPVSGSRQQNSVTMGRDMCGIKFICLSMIRLISQICQISIVIKT